MDMALMPLPIQRGNGAPATRTPTERAHPDVSAARAQHTDT